MSRRLFLVVTLPVAMAFPSAAFADQASVPTVQTPGMSAADQAEQADAKKIVCRSVLVTGSRFPERQCAPKYAWAKQEDEARKAGHDVIDRAVVNTTRGD